MAKKLTYDELSQKLYSMEEELRAKSNELINTQSQHYIIEHQKYLEGKVDAYEKIIELIEKFTAKEGEE